MQQTDCVVRAKCLTDVSYDVKLNLPRGEWYSGHITVNFMVKEAPTHDIFLDYRGIMIDNYCVNSETVPSQNSFRNHHVMIPSAMLRIGEQNTMTIEFLNKYRKDGVGLHSFVDKVDGQQYLYTQFEADFCHYVFPCFDQPDLKATWKFSCKTEADWTVISNEGESEPPTEEAKSALDEALCRTAENFKDKAETTPTDAKPVFFDLSYKISTYIYAIVAGPFGYHERVKEGFPNMRIYARKTIVQDVNHEEMFNVTESGMEFYKDFFGEPYPFRKYD